MPDFNDKNFPDDQPSKPADSPLPPQLLKSQAIPTPNPKLDTPKVQIKYPPFLWPQTQNVIKDLESKINSRVLVYYTHPSSQINNDDVEYFFSHVKELNPESSLTLILISSGGSGMAAWRIANVLRKYCQKLDVIVPSRCASAATLLSLSADTIYFGPAGYLTAIDTSLYHPLNPKASERGESVSVSVDQINKISNFINDDLNVHHSTKSLSEILFEKIHPIVLGELQRSSNLSKMIAKNMMKLRSAPVSEEEQERIVNVLNDSYPAHGYPIVLREAQQIGLPAQPLPEDLNSSVWELVKLYSLISKRATTIIDPELSHLEGIPVSIESAGRRTFFTISNDTRYKPQFGRVMENDKSRWLSAITNPESNDKPLISEIEL